MAQHEASKLRRQLDEVSLSTRDTRPHVDQEVRKLTTQLARMEEELVEDEMLVEASVIGDAGAWNMFAPRALSVSVSPVSPLDPDSLRKASKALRAPDLPSVFVPRAAISADRGKKLSIPCTLLGGSGEKREGVL